MYDWPPADRSSRIVIDSAQNGQLIVRSVSVRSISSDQGCSLVPLQEDTVNRDSDARTMSRDQRTLS